VNDPQRLVTETTKRWREVRGLMTRSRQELSHAAAGLYPDLPRVAGTDLLSRPDWLPPAPLPLESVSLEWAADPPAQADLAPYTSHVLPWRAPGERFGTYARAIAALDPPALFENRVCYRMLDASLLPARPRMTFSSAWFFDGLSVGHAVAHEYASRWDDGAAAVTLADLPLRNAIGDPRVFDRRPAVPAVITLTLRREGPGRAAFLLHWRDPAKVVHAGGAFQVTPAGVFQPAADVPAALPHDLSLWRAMVREFSEELLGSPEVLAGQDGRLDYSSWPFHRQLDSGLASGTLTVWLLGMGVDPLTLATDILTVAVIDADFFDDVFAGLVSENAEGRLVSENADGELVSDGPAAGLPFTQACVDRFSRAGTPIQAAGAALLQLAWRHRRQLLG
jgi:hypothetical protein